MGPLAVGGREFTRGNEAAAEKALFVLAVEQDDFHGQILVLAEQHANFGMAGAFFHGEPLPVDAMLPDGVHGLGEAREQGLLDLVKLEEGWVVRPAEGLAFAFDDSENFLTEGEMPAQIGGDVFRGGQGVATAPGMLLVPWRS
jgi:hypothetical protein